MAVYKTKTGKWQAVISYRDEDGVSRKKKKTFDLKRDAQKYEFEVSQNIGKLQEQESIPSGITFSDIFDDYVKYTSINANEETVAHRIMITNNFFGPILNKKMDSITKKNYLDLWHSIAGSDYSYSYKNKIITQLKSIADFAYVFYNIEDNTKTLPKLQRPIDDKPKMKIWTEEEFLKFIAEVDNRTFYIFFWTLYYTGLRRGEAMALQKDDLKDGSLSITKSIKNYKHGFRPLKNRASKRVVQLDNKTLVLIEELMDQDGTFIFGGLSSLSISSIQRRFKEAIERSGVPEIRLHDLRHSHASLLISKGANIVAVSKRLGHANTQTTLKTYTHLMKSSSDELIDILNNE